MGVCGKGSFGVRSLSGPMCAEGMGGGKRWVLWVLRGTGTASWRSGRCVNYLSRQFVPEWDNPDAESVLVTAGTISLLADLMGVAA